MKRRARILSILLASVIAFTSVSVNSSYYAYADEENAEEESDSGDSGDSGDDSDDSDEHEEESHEEDTEEKEEENNEEENNEEQETDESEGESQESAQEDTSGETSVEESTESPEEETTSTEESTSTETASSEENGNSEENASTEENSTEEASTEGTEEATEAKAPEINFSGIEDKTYDGKAVEFSESNIEVSDDAEYSWGYYMDEEGTEKIDNAPVDAGEYYIVVKTKETEELKSASKSQKFV